GSVAHMGLGSREPSCHSEWCGADRPYHLCTLRSEKVSGKSATGRGTGAKRRGSPRSADDSTGAPEWAGRSFGHDRTGQTRKPHGCGRILLCAHEQGSSGVGERPCAPCAKGWGAGTANGEGTQRDRRTG